MCVRVNFMTYLEMSSVRGKMSAASYLDVVWMVTVVLISADTAQAGQGRARNCK